MKTCNSWDEFPHVRKKTLVFATFFSTFCPLAWPPLSLPPFSLCGLAYRPRQPNFLTRFAAVLRLQKLFRDCFSWREKHILIPPRSRSLVSVCLSLPAREKGGKTPLQSSTWLVFKDAFSHHLEKSLSVNLPYHAMKQWYLKTEK